jgi:hypothetical protein
MDTTPYASSLQEHGKHLWKLSTELRATCNKLAQELHEQETPSETHVVRLLKRTTELNNSLFAATVFCQRLQVFLESTKRDRSAQLKN